MSDRKIDAEDIRRLFGALHASYGNKMLEMFRTGQVDDNGNDLGVLSAQRHWAVALRDVDASLLAPALNLCKRTHKTFPPTLPEIEELFRSAAKLRQYQTPPKVHPALPMSEEVRQKNLERVRLEIARARAKRPGGMGPVDKGVPGLLALVANAIGTAGGDEGEALLRLERSVLGKQ